jgi:hypothetical protein
LNVVNRHRDQAISTEFELEDTQFTGLVDATEVNGQDIKVENSFDSAAVQRRKARRCAIASRIIRAR